MTLIDQIHTPAAEVANPADAWTPTRAAARFAIDAQRIAELERSLTETRQRLTAAESDQITSGSDPRLHDFWVRAGRRQTRSNSATSTTVSPMQWAASRVNVSSTSRWRSP